MTKAREQHIRRTEGCLTDCLAYVFNQHPEHVPVFIYPRKGWMTRVRRWVGRRGFRCYWQRVEDRPIPRRGVVIVCGDSLRWKTYAHAVVYRGGRMVFDPAHPSEWSDARATHWLCFEEK